MQPGCSLDKHLFSVIQDIRELKAISDNDDHLKEIGWFKGAWKSVSQAAHDFFYPHRMFTDQASASAETKLFDTAVVAVPFEPKS